VERKRKNGQDDVHEKSLTGRKANH